MPRRDTDSRVNALAGGRVFPGVQHLSRFTASDRGGRVSIRVDADDSEVPLVDMQVSEADRFPPESIFGTLDESSQFFESGCVGYSARPGSGVLDGMKLEVTDWRVSPLNVDFVRSAYFDDQAVFPPESIKFDHALLMRDILHEWHSEPKMTTLQTSANKAGQARRDGAPGV